MVKYGVAVNPQCEVEGTHKLQKMILPGNMTVQMQQLIILVQIY